MRAFHIANLDKARPVLVLTRDIAREHMTNVTVAYVTSTIRGLSTELAVGPRNQLDHHSVVSLDNIITIPKSSLGRQIGWLMPDQEPQLTAAISAAFDLEPRGW